jgi:5'-nucleotidase
LAQDPVLTQTPNLASAGAGPSSAPAAVGVAPRAKAGAAPVATAGAPAATYTVRKGDTLFKIAKDHYGDGKQWSRIVAANPGLTPASLKAGQKLHLP